MFDGCSGYYYSTHNFNGGSDYGWNAEYGRCDHDLLLGDLGETFGRFGLNSKANDIVPVTFSGCRALRRRLGWGPRRGHRRRRRGAVRHHLPWRHDPSAQGHDVQDGRPRVHEVEAHPWRLRGGGGYLGHLHGAHAIVGPIEPLHGGRENAIQEQVVRIATRDGHRLRRPVGRVPPKPSRGEACAVGDAHRCGLDALQARRRRPPRKYGALNVQQGDWDKVVRVQCAVQHRGAVALGQVRDLGIRVRLPWYPAGPCHHAVFARTGQWASACVGVVVVGNRGANHARRFKRRYGVKRVAVAIRHGVLETCRTTVDVDKHLCGTVRWVQCVKAKTFDVGRGQDLQVEGGLRWDGSLRDGTAVPTNVGAHEVGALEDEVHRRRLRVAVQRPEADPTKSGVGLDVDHVVGEVGVPRQVGKRRVVHHERLQRALALYLELVHGE